MMPVEEGKISSAETPNSFPASRQTRSQARMPEGPVAQFAFPEFTMTARTRPPVESNDALPTSMGAATTRFFVNNAAAAAPPATSEPRSNWRPRLRSGRTRDGAHPHTSTSARSGRPLALMPAATAEKENPSGKRILSGELLRRLRSEVMPEFLTSFSAAARWQTLAVPRGSSALRRSDKAWGTYNNLCGSCQEDPDDLRRRIPCVRKIPGCA